MENISFNIFQSNIGIDFAWQNLRNNFFADLTNESYGPFGVVQFLASLFCFSLFLSRLLQIMKIYFFICSDLSSLIFIRYFLYTLHFYFLYFILFIIFHLLHIFFHILYLRHLFLTDFLNILVRHFFHCSIIQYFSY